MSETLKGYKFGQKTKRHASYPWGDWTDGRVHRIAYGDHFECTPAGMYQTLHSRAKRHGMDLDIEYDENDATKIVFRFKKRRKKRS